MLPDYVFKLLDHEDSSSSHVNFAIILYCTKSNELCLDVQTTPGCSTDVFFLLSFSLFFTIFSILYIYLSEIKLRLDHLIKRVNYGVQKLENVFTLIEGIQPKL